MKLSNLFKKSTVTKAVKIEKLEKNQLSKVIGGVDSDPITDATVDGAIKKGPGKSSTGATTSGA